MSDWMPPGAARFEESHTDLEAKLIEWGPDEVSRMIGNGLLTGGQGRYAERWLAQAQARESGKVAADATKAMQDSAAAAKKAAKWAMVAAIVAGLAFALSLYAAFKPAAEPSPAAVPVPSTQSAGT